MKLMRATVLILLLSLGVMRVMAQQAPHVEKVDHVITGTYRVYDNALRMAKKVTSLGYEANVGYYAVKGFYYVYIFRSASEAKATKAALVVRSFEDFPDAWVLRGKLINMSGSNYTPSAKSKPQTYAKKATSNTPSSSQEAETNPSNQTLTDTQTYTSNNANSNNDVAEPISDSPSETKYKTESNSTTTSQEETVVQQEYKTNKNETTAQANSNQSMIKEKALVVPTNRAPRTQAGKSTDKKTSSEPAIDKDPAEGDAIQDKTLQELQEIAAEKKEEIEAKEKEAAKKALNANFKYYTVYLNAYSKEEVKEVITDIKMVDGKRSKLINKLETHKYLTVRRPKRPVKKDEMQLICTAFGFRKMQVDLNFMDPVNETSESYIHLEGDTIVVDFELLEYEKGDIAVMFNVFFYKDAAIMLGKSKYELKMLLAMMKKNEGINITIHGHTNGNKSGKIIRLKKGDKSYFKLTENNTTGFGSAKKLSLYRSQIIKDWLMSKGIAKNRIKTVGWGGKRMLYDKDSPQAIKNIRVEVEIRQL